MVEQVKAKVVEKMEIPKYKAEDPKCIHLVYADGVGYCHASIRDKEFRCDHANYNASSYFPPCRKYPKQYQ